MRPVVNRLLPLLALVASPSLTQGQGQPDWAVRCETEGDKRCYLVQNVFLAESKQRLAGLALSRQGADVVSLVSVPLGVDLPAGAQMQVDGGPPLAVAYQMCNPQGCHGGRVLPPDTLRALRRAKTLIISYQDPSGRRIGVPFSLKDFQRGWEALPGGGAEPPKGTSKAAGNNHNRLDL